MISFHDEIIHFICIIYLFLKVYLDSNRATLTFLCDYLHIYFQSVCVVMFKV